MPGTFSQIYVQYVFAVQGRQNFIQPSFEDDLYKYIAGIINGKGQKSLAVNGTADHVHALVGLKPAMCISDLIRDVKNNSSNFINHHKWLKQKFNWQEGYGVFSYSHSAFGNVIEYIRNQKIHHHKRTFREEYLETLRLFDLPFEEKYSFEFYD